MNVPSDIRTITKNTFGKYVYILLLLQDV